MAVGEIQGKRIKKIVLYCCPLKSSSVISKGFNNPDGGSPWSLPYLRNLHAMPKLSFVLIGQQ